MAQTPLDRSKKQIRLLHLHPETQNGTSPGLQSSEASSHLRLRSLVPQRILDRSKRYTRILHRHPKTIQGRNEGGNITEATRPESRNAGVAIPVQGHLDIRCTFALASLDENPDYEALSYVWGDDTTGFRVTVDGSPFFVTPNLYSALRHLRLEDRDRVLWIDALCINQADDAERTHQVSCMGDIYREASSVIVWLGEESASSEIAMDFLELWSRDSSLHFDASVGPALTVKGMSITSYKLREQVIQFFWNPWWQRLWTVQEFVLARKIVLQRGKHVLNYETIEGIGDIILRHRNGCCSKFESYMHVESRESGISLSSALGSMKMLNITRRLKNSINFEYLLANFRSRLSADPRDKIYGMLGMATGVYQNFIKPEYTSSIEQVFESTIIKIIERTGMLNVFSLLCFNGRRKLDLPSFVVDWTVQIDLADVNHCVNRIASLGYYFASDDGAELNSTVPGEIVLRGFIFDTVSKVSHKWNEMNSKEALDECCSLAQLDKNSETSYSDTDSSRETTLWQTLCGGILFEFEDMDQARHVDAKRDFEKYKKWYKWKVTPCLENTSLYDRDVANFNLTYHSTTKNRKFVVTEKGRFGFAPLEVLAGDLVAILDGGRVPYILRPDAMGREHRGVDGVSNTCYNILGDSYIHGIMQGEAPKLFEEMGRKKSEIILV